MAKSGDRIRIKDIAEKAGISIGTVDRVLHNRGEVKEDELDEHRQDNDRKTPVADKSLDLL